jgi:hypothetical protein
VRFDVSNLIYRLLIIRRRPTIGELQQTAVEAIRIARTHAMDVHVNKHTNATLATAKSHSASYAENKILIMIECRVKTQPKRKKRQTHPNLGKCPQPWNTDRYLSGTSPTWLRITTKQLSDFLDYRGS